MSYGSAAPYVKDALVTLFTARAGLAGVKVMREWPRTEEDTASVDGTPEVIWIGRQGHQDIDSTSDVTILTAGKLRFDEALTVWTTVQVRHNEGTMESASERAWTLAFEMIGAAANTPGLGITAPEVAYFYVDGNQSKEHTRHLDRGGSACEIILGFDCRARIDATS